MKLASAFLLLAMMAIPAAAGGEGAAFGARDPRVCPVMAGPALNQQQATQLFICNAEGVKEGGQTLALVSDAIVKLGLPMRLRVAQDDLDTSAPVYDITGSYQSWTCKTIGDVNGARGHNCTQWPQPKASGTCYRTKHSGWHCGMIDTSYDNYPNHNQPPPNRP